MSLSEIRSFHDLKKDDGISAIISIDEAHAEIHEGEHFTVTSYDLTLADNETHTVYFRTPASPTECHMVAEVSAPLAGEFEVRESATCSLSGTVLTPRNSNRNSTNTATAVVRHTPTITASGTLLDFLMVGTGSGPKAPGGVGEGRFEWILKYGTVYLFRFTSAANSNGGVVALRWYEEG